MRILSNKNLFLPLSFFIFGITNIQAQDTPNSSSVDSILNNFINEEIVFEPQEAEVIINQDPRIQTLLDVKAEMDKAGTLGDNYKIQLYNGNLNQAQTVRKKAVTLFPQWEIEIQYETPEYKVWIGNYRSKLHTDRALKDIREEFPGAFSFNPEKK
ncbi:SPOR domain-containing protein [Aquimarina sp. 2201CG5-10]|uniref:SPOR domain-containing protein n=1 Tax=Aquimarina callyspongiae TaxID=3098150 RepID=UPI002AB4CC9F|nr:SPOR domain-containing protein [Aquimarina sp. 2201CG5-10]MDY8136729.1 SPOR domain-containing protein [Aquimarina sp. 2201CG5-10]